MRSAIPGKGFFHDYIISILKDLNQKVREYLLSSLSVTKGKLKHLILGPRGG